MGVMRPWVSAPPVLLAALGEDGAAAQVLCRVDTHDEAGLDHPVPKCHCVLPVEFLDLGALLHRLNGVVLLDG